MESIPRTEARALLAMARRTGETADNVRELISIPEEIEKLLRTYVRANPAEGSYVEMSLRFRAQVLAEFEDLARALPIRSRTRKRS